MSDKPWEKLNPIDVQLRKAFPVGNTDGTQGVRCTIEMISGFELFNTRPYHNYETFSSGYRVSNPDGSIVVRREDLDDAITEFIRKVKENK